MAKQIEVLVDQEGNVWVGHKLKNGDPSADSRKLTDTEMVSIFSHMLALKCSEAKKDEMAFVDGDGKPFLYAKFLNLGKDGKEG